MPRGRTETVLTTSFDHGRRSRGPDELIVEEPMSIHLDDVLVATTMRTPGHDFELAVGFCFTDGLLAAAPVVGCRYCGTGSAVDTEFNVVSVDTGGQAPAPTPRLGTVSSSCGLCGSTSLDELADRLEPLTATTAIPLEVLAAVPDRVRAEQDLFDLTGAVHAAAAFDASGQPLLVREDVGRHNAVDKVVGHLLLEGALPAADLGLYVSGRASFEIVQKAWAAGFSALVAVSAPTALAVATARRAGLTLAGFVRGDRVNVYAPERVATVDLPGPVPVAHP
ncbi:MAG: formate dehydrogenase accessory sulfurtransferase FdhD [Acidimicrobiales bacterium]